MVRGRYVFLSTQKILLNEMEFNEITNAEIELIGVFKLENTEKRYLASQTIANRRVHDRHDIMQLINI
jgi:hypothetical protein